jgi:MFS family permease
METPMSYRALVRTVSPGFFFLGFLARLPCATAPLATLILLAATTGSYTFAGLATASQSLTVAVSGPVIGALADRYGHRPLGVATAVGNIIALAGLIAASRADRGTMFAAATLAGLTQPQVGPLVRVHWSYLFHTRNRPGLLPTALSYEAAADETSFVAGPAIVGLLTSIATPIGPIVATILLLAGAALPFALLYGSWRVPRQQRSTMPKAPLPRRPLGVMFLAMAAMGMVFGAVQTGVTAYANAAGQPGAAGLLYAELGVGSALTGVACAWLPERFTLRQRYVTFAATLLAGMLSLLASDSLLSLQVAIVVASVTVAPYMISLYALTGRLVPPHQAAVAMTILCAGGPLGTAAGRALAGHLADTHGSAGAFAVAPIAAAGALVLALAAAAADRGRGVWLGSDQPVDRC